MAYRERLKNWESREDKRRKEYQIEKKKEIQRKKLLCYALQTHFTPVLVANKHQFLFVLQF